jgi:anti-anti-sigma regulatory factor
MLDYQATEEGGGKVRFRLRGDLAGEPWTLRLLEALGEDYANDGVSTILVDLSETASIDLEGVATLLELRAESSRNHKRFLVEGASGQVRGKLEQTGVLGLLEQG